MTVFLLNRNPEYRRALDPSNARTLGVEAATEVERFLALRENDAPTPLLALRSLAAALGVAFPRDRTRASNISTVATRWVHAVRAQRDQGRPVAGRLHG
jgi:hypothetical protein